MLCTQRNDREKEYTLFPRERERESLDRLQEVLPCFVAKTNYSGSSCKYGRRFRSLVFAIIAVTAHRGATDRSNYYIFVVTAASQSRKNTRTTYRVVGWLARCCEMWRTTSFAVSQTAHRDERVPHIARALRSPTLNRVRGTPLIWVAGQSTTTTATFQDSDSRRCYFQLAASHTSVVSIRKKNYTFRVESGCGP